jgi:hypothetical protein
MAMVLGSVKDERCFFNLFFIKNKLRNWLKAHLDLVVWMYAQSFYTIETFLFTIAIRSWDQQKKLEGCRCIVNTKIAQQTLTTKPKP